MFDNKLTIKKKNKGSSSLIGKITSLYMALAYLGGIIIFIAILRYHSLASDSEKVLLLTEKRDMMFLTNLIMYVLFGPVLILYILDLQSKLSNKETILIRFSSLMGYIWAGSLTASGMIANGSIEPVSLLYRINPDQAMYLWQIQNAVVLGLGNGNGEILGGLMTLGFGIAQLREDHFSKGLGFFGIIIGIIGILSLVPPLIDMTAVFGILQLVWFILTGFSTAKNEKKRFDDEA